MYYTYYYYHTYMSSNRCTPGTCTTLMRYCLCIQYIHSYYTGTCTSIYNTIYYIHECISCSKTKKVIDFSYAFMHNFHVWLQYGTAIFFFYSSTLVCVRYRRAHSRSPPPTTPFALLLFLLFPATPFLASTIPVTVAVRREIVLHFLLLCFFS